MTVMKKKTKEVEEELKCKSEGILGARERRVSYTSHISKTLPEVLLPIKKFSRLL
jgi:hypothetical protein